MIAATDEKAILALAVEHAGKGSSYDGIAMILNEEGYLNAKGAEWTGSTVSALLVKNGFRKRAPAVKAAAKKSLRKMESGSDDCIKAAIGMLKMDINPELRIRAALALLEPTGGSDGQSV
jgi:hypothetical protein